MTAAIRVSGLTKRYGSVIAVNDLSFEVPVGASFGLLGPNGAGKSTTFGVLCGWLRPTRGDTSVLGTPSAVLHRLRGQISALPQDAQLPVAAPIRSSLLHYARLSGLRGSGARAEVARVLELLALTADAGKRGGELSHGMSKRAGIAAALIGTPRVVFLDEPTAGLDPQNAKTIRDLIAGKPSDQTIVVSSHNLAEVQDVCTHGAILDHGTLTALGTMDELTHRGQRATFRFRGAPTPFLSSVTSLDLVDDAVVGPDGFLRVTFKSGTDPAVVIGHVLRVLLDSGVPILGVEVGTSLEDAFLEITSVAP
jgi:ABC-type multidrug transport system ATPase subunit